MRMVAAIVLISGIVTLTVLGCAVTVQTPAPAPPPSRPPAPAQPPYEPARGIDVQFFYDSLDPYGDWVRVEPYGWAWAPGAVDPFWRPYTVGRWVWTDYGWTWVSTERWGWAAYHYGRWARVPRHGWVWVPGTVWAPAWVAWRSGPGVLGWAPLPPEVGFRSGVGLDLSGLDLDVVIRPDYWCFVDDARVFEPQVVRYAYPVARNVTVIPRTTRTLRIDVRDNRVVNPGVEVRGQGRAIPHYRIVDDDAMRGREASIRGEEVHMWRPQAREAPQSAHPRRAFERPVQAPPPGQEAQDDDLPPTKPAPPAVERRIERGWEQDWSKLMEMQKKDPLTAPTPPRGRSTASDKPPAPRPPSKIEREREENYRAAENAYKEQQAERARVEREQDKPRPTPPPRADQGAGAPKGKAKGKAQKGEKEEKDEER
jgi:hypothetical protein